MLPGKPQAYKPPRFRWNGGNVYTLHHKPMKSAREVLAEEMKAPPLRDVPLIVFIELYFRRPKSHFKKGTLRTDAPKYVTKTPDVDNCIKFVLDALQPKVVADDKFVTKVIAEKKWCDDATAELTVSRVRNGHKSCLPARDHRDCTSGHSRSCLRWFSGESSLAPPLFRYKT